MSRKQSLAETVNANNSSQRGRDVSPPIIITELCSTEWDYHIQKSPDHVAVEGCRDREIFRADCIILGRGRSRSPNHSDIGGSDYESEDGPSRKHAAVNLLCQQPCSDTRIFSEEAVIRIAPLLDHQISQPAPGFEVGIEEDVEIDKDEHDEAEFVSCLIPKILGAETEFDKADRVMELEEEGPAVPDTGQFQSQRSNLDTGSPMMNALSFPLQSSIRRKPFSILSIADGHWVDLNLTATELLKMVRTSREYHRSGCLKLRDLRQICSTGVGSQRPSIEPRRSCVLVNMPKTRALIMKDRALLIGVERREDLQGMRTTGDVRSMLTPQTLRNCKPTVETCPPMKEPLLGWRASFNDHSNEHTRREEVLEKTMDNGCFLSNLDKNEPLPDFISSSLVRKLVRLSSIKRASPFEFLCLEAILFEVISKMGDFVNPACEMTEQLKLQKMQHLSSTEKLHQIRELKRFLQEAESVSQGVANSLSEILENEEDVRRLEVSRFHEKPTEWDEPSDSPGAEDAEILLESYQQDIESIVLKIRSTDETLDTLLQIMQLQLATTRNLLLKFEIALQVISVVVGGVSAVAGIFGMNMPNGYENRADVFWNVTRLMSTILLVTCATVILVSTRLRL